MLEFELIDDTENIELELENNKETIDLTLTDYDDSEVRELIGNVDNKVDTLETNVNHQLDDINNDISSLERNVQTNTTVPTLANANAFQNIPADCRIVVPDDLYSTWIGSSNWSTRASQIIKESDWNA